MFVKHLFFAKFFRYLFLIIFSIAIAVLAVIYLDSGKIIFDIDLFSKILNENRKLIFVAIIFVSVAQIAAILHQNQKFQNMPRCTKYVPIEEVAHNWLSKERLEALKNTEKKNSSEAQRPIYAVSFEKERTRQFYETIIAKNLDKINHDEAVIIIGLLNLLEEKGDIPSVVGYFDKDPENVFKYDTASFSGQNSYQILKQISLYDHTLNVATQIEEEVQQKDRTIQYLYYGKAIIAALAHDIGKIKKMEDKIKRVPIELFSTQPHQQISKLFFREMFGGYEGGKLVMEAIENHHTSKIPSTANPLVKMLIDADKKARAQELAKYDEKAELPATNRKRKELKILNDIDEGKDFQDIAVGGSATKYQKKSVAKKDYVNIDVFDIELFETKIFDELRLSINKSENHGLEMWIKSISYKDMILFHFKTIKDVIEKVVSPENSEEMTRYFIRHYRKRGEIGYVDTEKGYFTFKFILKRKGRSEAFFAVPFFARAFGLNEDRLKAMRLGDAWLKEIEVLKQEEAGL